MSTEHIIQSTIELIAIIIIIYGLTKEDKIIRFEDNVKRIIVGNLENYRRYKRIKKEKKERGE